MRTLSERKCEARIEADGRFSQDVDPALLARYPFLPEAAELVRGDGPPLDRLLTATAWGGARAQGKARVLAALDGEPVPAVDATTDHEALVVILGYVVARLLVSAVNDQMLTNRYATAEARRAGELLERELPETLLHVGAALGIRAESRERLFAVPFTDHLRAAKDIKAMEWKLVNQTLDRGQVLLTRERLARLAQEALKFRLLSELPLDVPRELVQGLAPLPQEIRTRLDETRSRSFEGELKGVEPSQFPPCMTALIAAIKRSENVSHEGRFAVVSFLHTIGMTREAIIDDLFSSVPDFAREVTTYQVDHITGQKSKEAYTPPGCSTLQSYGLCPMMTRAKGDWDRWCAHEKMKHPLTYYRWGLFKLSQRKEREGAAAPPALPQAAAEPSERTGAHLPTGERTG